MKSSRTDLNVETAMFEMQNDLSKQKNIFNTSCQASEIGEIKVDLNK